MSYTTVEILPEFAEHMRRIVPEEERDRYPEIALMFEAGEHEISKDGVKQLTHWITMCIQRLHINLVMGRLTNVAEDDIKAQEMFGDVLAAQGEVVLRAQAPLFDAQEVEHVVRGVLSGMIAENHPALRGEDKKPEDAIVLLREILGSNGFNDEHFEAALVKIKSELDACFTMAETFKSAVDEEEGVEGAGEDELQAMLASFEEQFQSGEGSDT